MTYLKKILQFAKPYKRFAILNIISNVFYALFSTLAFISFIPMLRVLFQEEKPISTKPVWNGEFGNIKDFANDYSNYFLNQQVEQYGEIAALVSICITVIVLFFLKNLFNYLALYFIANLRNGMLKDIRNRIYDKIVELPVSFFSEKRKGDFISRITSDVQEIQTSFLSMLELFVKEPLTLIFTLVFMIGISPKLTLFVLVFLPLAGLLISTIGKKLKSQSTQAQQENANFLTIVEESLSSLKIIKGFNAEDKFKRKFYSSTGRLNQILNTLLHRQNLASPMSEFLGVVVITIILWFGGRMVLIDNTMDASTFIGFLVLTYNILTPAKAISKATYSIQKGNASAERILEILETESTIQDDRNAVKKESFDENIEVENINFRYEKENVLKNFSMQVEKGKMIALVGQSGSGKSTIANLITRFYDVNEGVIKLDGHNIKGITKKSLRNLMGLVTQDSILFNDTVKNNIALGKDNATKEEIIEALKVANAWDFVKELPEGLETNIGDSGNKLSGGQKQRLSIARAVLKNPPIMILDEATSALDTESEKLVQKALENMMKNRTSIVIAHRLSTIQNADKIIVLHRGEIVEQGKHLELLAQKGTYQKLVEMQSFD
ncbi:ABC transporter ATP-binding protein [Salegentibacter mishustinae]|uniref:Antibiotic ABC transporter ATP-binding protein n=1 Tax=Salegentibacter mishustinae TaxID=270918 RepID=A0A0Q9ZLI0_9FLAO|nr:ABC transporter ATP-binding protein [Salegentibacter mishustinae]KRG30158.1 antibiotic ABC transporter ATP-binding protein [Salegentibacter mishustinae]PNW19461.1 antibiotic ABC transporter ATP-binding protein [Salegentibacter mishustinae]PZX62091.1 ATP-binding cassette, subfamily B, MsbA [Salegentibacter mishustinae]GGW94565.1 antibiotic ABC transporter ATP-binding protein [Salegentibacter mishustinae]